MTRALRRLGSAHAGTGEWLLQRFTALMILVLLLAFGVRLLQAPPETYAAWVRLWSEGAVRLGFLAFGFAVVIHGGLGLRSVCRDYLRRPALRVSADLLLAIAMLAELLWCLRVLT